MQKETEHQLISAIYENKEYFTRIARRFLRSEADVEDALQEMIFNAFKSMKNLNEPKYMKTWMTRILINQCINTVRRQPPQTAPIQNETGMNDANYQKTEIRQLVDMLSPDLKSIAILYYYEDLAQKDISAILDMPVGTVKSKLHDARAQLRDMLAEGE